MNLLFVSPYVPSPMRIRPYAFIRDLARQGHQITLACLVQPNAEEKYLNEVRPYCKAVHPVYPRRTQPLLRALASLPTAEPLSVAYCHTAEFTHLVQTLANSRDFDLVHTEFIRAVPATMALHGLPKVFDAVDSLALTYRRSLSAAQVSPRQRLIALIEWVKMNRYETRVLSAYDRILISSPADRKALESGRNGHSIQRKNGLNSRQDTGRKPEIRVIPNGVDARYFSFHTGQRDQQTIVFLGKMSYYVNVASVIWFYREVLPLVKARMPKIRFKIVGRDPVKKIRDLAGDPAVEVTGTLPDIRPHIAGAAVNVCPMVTGGGIQNKILEAMALGTPTVATPIACDAVQVQDGREVLIATDPQSFAQAILRLVEDQGLQQDMSYSGRRYVEIHHDWSSIGDELNAVYNSLTAHS